MLAREEWSIPKVPAVKPDVFSLESLIGWLETMPADDSYCYQHTGACLHHQYFTAMGETVNGVGGTYIMLGGRPVNLSDGFRKVAVQKPHTFGAALSRARALSTAKASQ